MIPVAGRECRSMGHAWEHHHDDDFEYAGGHLSRFTRAESCLRCGATRHRDIDLRHHEVTRTRMSYAPGYLVKGQGRIKRGDAIAALYNDEEMTL